MTKAGRTGRACSPAAMNCQLRTGAEGHADDMWTGSMVLVEEASRSNHVSAVINPETRFPERYVPTKSVGMDTKTCLSEELRHLDPLPTRLEE